MKLSIRVAVIVAILLWIPFYLNTYYQKKYKFNKNYCPESMSYYSRCLSLPIHTSLNQSDIRFISKKINFLIKKYVKK